MSVETQVSLEAGEEEKEEDEARPEQVDADEAHGGRGGLGEVHLFFNLL